MLGFQPGEQGSSPCRTTLFVAVIFNVITMLAGNSQGFRVNNENGVPDFAVRGEELASLSQETQQNRLCIMSKCRMQTALPDTAENRRRWHTTP